MSDPLGIALTVVMLLFVPVLLLVPLVITAMTPSKVSADAERTAARGKVLILALATLLVLGCWFGAIVASLRFQSQALRQTADMAWTLFFPLWFGLAVPAIKAKNPTWGTALNGPIDAHGDTRTASFTNRDRENPVKARHWVLAVGLGVGLIAGIAVRGFSPFTTDNIGLQDHTRWLLSLALTTGLYALTLTVMPFVIKCMNLAPEPLDTRGSKELVELYKSQRIRRTLSLFWLLAVVLPAFLGGIFLVATWLPGHSSALGLLGGIGGSVLGIVGAAFGVAATAERVRIAELRAKLNSH